MADFGRQAGAMDLGGGWDYENTSAFPVLNKASYASTEEAYDFDSRTYSQDHFTEWTPLYGDNQIPNLVSNYHPTNHSHSLAPVGPGQSTCVPPEQVNLRTDLDPDFWHSTDSSFEFLDALAPNHHGHVHLGFLGLRNSYIPCSNYQ